LTGVTDVNSPVTCPCNKNSVLIADDEDALLEVFSVILVDAMPQLEIDLASDGAEAVELFGRKHHAVVLMDLRMPVMDGRTAFFELQKVCDEKAWQMPSVVFCTGFVPPDAVRQIVTGNPVHALMHKPVSNDALVAAVRERLVS